MTDVKGPSSRWVTQGSVSCAFTSGHPLTQLRPFLTLPLLFTTCPHRMLTRNWHSFWQTHWPLTLPRPETKSPSPHAALRAFKHSPLQTWRQCRNSIACVGVGVRGGVVRREGRPLGEAGKVTPRPYSQLQIRHAFLFPSWSFWSHL